LHPDRASSVPHAYREKEGLAVANTSFDLIVIGGGPGGYVAAIRAAQLGVGTAVVEREHLGGICLNWGCIPTKALLRSAEVYRQLGRASAYGLSTSAVGFDLGKIVDRSRAVAGRLQAGVKHLLKKNKVTVFEGHGCLHGPKRVRVSRDGKSMVDLTAPHILIATGARPKTLPGIDFDGSLVWTYKQAMVPKTMPKSLLIVGAGAIGIEFASFYNAFGVDVTMVEVLDRILPAEDEEISVYARKALEKQGLRVFTGATVQALKKGADSVTATISGKQKPFELTVDRVILAVGIVGNVEGIGIEGTRARVEKSQIVVDEWLRTDEPGVYAVGDVAGPPWLAHKASHEGVICVEKIAGFREVRPLEKRKIPSCVYGHPQVARLGLAEREARNKGYKVRVGRFPFAGNGKAAALGEEEGFVKTVFDEETGALLGAHMVGSEVTELIHGFSIAGTLETTAVELAQTVFPHPTLSEIMRESVLDAYGRVIHF